MSGIPNLTDEQWAELLERLTHRALRKYRRCGWGRGNRNKCEWAGPGGTTPEDIALEAVSLVMSGQRRYDAHAHPDFLNYMRSVVDSLVSHLAEKAAGRKTSRMPLRPNSDTGDMVEVEFQGTDPDPADVCVAREVMELTREVVSADADGDPLVTELFECFEAGITKRADVAEYLEVDVSEVDNAQKRFRRKLDQRFAVDKERQR